MKSAHEICGCLDGVRCALTADRDELLRRVNSAENRARLAEDRERLIRDELARWEVKYGMNVPFIVHQMRLYEAVVDAAEAIDPKDCSFAMEDALKSLHDAQEPRT